MKRINTIIWMLAIMATMTMGGCDFSKKKQEPQPNIDSLVDAKVAEHLSQFEAELVPKTESHQGPTAIDEKAERMETAAPVKDEDYYQVLEGQIGPYAITMYLQDLSLMDESDIVGYYFYNDRPHSKFKLKMVSMVAVNAKGSMRLVLNEYTPKGFHSGTFNGQYECRGDYYSGTFTNSKGKKFDFTLE